jgi:hypothetical protein
VNLSNTQLTPDEEVLLKKGLSFAPHQNPRYKDLVSFTSDVETSLLTHSFSDKSIVAYKISKSLLNPKPKSPSFSQTIRTLSQKISSQNLIITKADKGNTVTVLDKSIYIDKVQDFISSSLSIPLKKDPTPKFQSQVRNLINSCPIHFPTHKKHLYASMNPRAPILYGLPKIHKEDTPIRPIASFTQAPTYPLCKWLTSYLPHKLSFRPKYTIKNSLDLIQKIKNINVPPNSTLVSFDIKNLYPSVPIPDLKNILSLLITSKISSPLEREELTNLTDICLEQNYFLFNGQYYSQSHGLPMGSPSSGLFADIFLDTLETQILNLPSSKRNISFWYRYVDDVICLWTGSTRQLDIFLTLLNSLNSSIQFTMETEQNLSLNFLDLTISHTTSKFSYKIFRKATYTDSIIPNDSSHPPKTKKAALYSMINRLMSIPLSPPDYEREKNIILQIALNNGYNENTVVTIINKVNKRMMSKHLYGPCPNETPNFRRIHYIPSLAPLITNSLKEHKITPAFYTNNTLKHILVNNKLDKTPPMQNSGVYQIRCDDCTFEYIGQTGRTFKTRINEHLRPMKNNAQTSKIAEHILNTNHSFNPDNLNILHIQKKGKKLDALERFEIFKACKEGKDLLNDQTFLSPSPILNIINFGI